MSPSSISGGYRFGFQARNLPPRLHAADVMIFLYKQKNLILSIGIIKPTKLNSQQLI